ncbi:MAG: hypothetical protein WC651_04910 [Candidatus Gracilibacteria bacterium]|jgi:hypothetical protein
MKNKTKTIGKILSGITITNIIVALFALTLSFSTTSFAADDNPKPTTLDPKTIELLDTALSEQEKKENQCITDKDRVGGWVITFVEEPLSLEEDLTDPKLQKRICYRNTLRFLNKDGIEKTLPILSRAPQDQDTGCSSKAEALANDPEMISKYKVSYNCRAIMVILAKGGASFIEGYVGLIYRWAAGLSGLIAVIVVIISSIQISLAGGESGEIGKAKDRILKSLAGIAVLFLSGLILYTINPTFFTR